jgi:hypothetical protein
MSEITYHGLAQAVSFEECRRLTNDESKMLIRLCMSSGVPVSHFKKTTKDIFLAKILIKRIEYYGVKVEHLATPEAYVMLLSLPECDSPGAVVMWAYTLAYLAAQAGHPISLSDLCYIYATGFPTKETMERCWDAQKIADIEQRKAHRTDNLLDLNATWEPFVSTIRQLNQLNQLNQPKEGRTDG